MMFGTCRKRWVRFLIAALVSITVLASSSASAAEAVRYRMSFPNHRAGQAIDVETLRFWMQWLGDGDFDVAGFDRRAGAIDIITRDPKKATALKDRGFTVLHTELSGPLTSGNRSGGVPAGYVDPAALESFLFTEVADHPTLTDLTIIGVTHEGRNIYAMEVSSNPGVAEDKPALLLNGLHHAREVVTPHVVMDAITFLTDGFEAGNPQVVDWLNRYKVFCVPMVNPDGSNRVHTVDNFHRKNMRPVCIGVNQGVDLNRNYPYHWGSGVVNCERGSGSSGSICSDAYRGASVGSEPETQAMESLAQQQHFVIAVSYHASGRFIDYPYACNDGNPDGRMPEHDIIDELMRGTANAIAGVDAVQYDVFSPIAIGPVNGDDTSWYYAHMGAYPLLIEVGTSFQPAFATGMAIVNRNRAGWTYLLDRLGEARIDVRVTDQGTGDPLVATVELLDFVFDTDELPRTTDPLFGRSRWMVPPNGTYTVRVSAGGFQTQTLDVAVAGAPVDVAVALVAGNVVLGDFEPDGDIDMHDYLQYLLCLRQLPLAPGCTVFDFTGDGTLTLADYMAFQSVLLGP